MTEQNEESQVKNEIKPPVIPQPLANQSGYVPPHLRQQQQAPPLATKVLLVDETPEESVDLPSRGITYSVDSPLHMQTMLSLRSMTSKEEDILTSRAIIKQGKVFHELLRACLTNKSIEPSEMLGGDVNALMITLRAMSYSHIYNVGVECTKCSHEYENDFDLSKLEIKFLDIAPIEPGVNEFEFVLPRTNRKVRFKFLTLQDQEMIEKTVEKMKQTGQVVDNYITTRLRFSVLSVDGVSDKNQLMRYLTQLNSFDSKALRSYIDKHEPGVKMKQEATCTKCGHAEEVSVPLGVTFFYPDD